MKHYRNQFFSMLTGILIVFGTVPATHADDTDVFFMEAVQGGGGNTNPNILFVFDTSGSMRDNVSGGKKIDILKNVVSGLVNGYEDVNVGFCNYGEDQGCQIIHEMAPVNDTTRPGMLAAIAGLEAAGFTPRAEAHSEAVRYFAGMDLKFGYSGCEGWWRNGYNGVWDTRNDPRRCKNVFEDYGANKVKNPPSVAASRVGNDINSTTYKSPITQSGDTGTCSPHNYIVHINDGGASQDGRGGDGSGVGFGLWPVPGYQEDPEEVPTWPGFQAATGKTYCEQGAAKTVSPEWWMPDSEHYTGFCLDEIAAYAQNHDISPLPGKQTVKSIFIGFDHNETALQNAAAAGGGQYVTANNAGQLNLALNNIVEEVIAENTNIGSYAAPSVPVNSYNRMQNRDEVFVSVFEPSINYHWPGNVKRYKLEGGQLVDQNGAAAVDPATGFFADGTQSFWSAGTDGADSKAGGAAYDMNAYASNVLYSNLTGDSTNNMATGGIATVVATGNGNITKAMLGIPGSEPNSRINDMIEWLKGRDVFDKTGTVDPDSKIVSGNGSNTDTRQQMGAPMHSGAIPLYYSADSGNLSDFRVFSTTTDGYLHAIDPETGTAAWSFMPRRLLDRSWNLANDPEINYNSYGLDGQAVLHIKDNDNYPGINTAVEKAYLVLSQRRGGRGLWGLNVTNKDAPELAWVIDADEAAAGTPLTVMGQTWSTPTFAKVKINGTPTDVAIVGGGYDDGQDNLGYHTDARGNAIYMINVETGAVEWSAGGTLSIGHNLEMNTGATEPANATMQHSIPAQVKSFDLTGDGLHDRMYAVDMGGRIWRFDIDNDAGSLADLVQGGLIASLGAAETGLDTDARRFYASPDVVPVIADNPEHDSYLAINVGTGHRAKPLDKSSDDWFFSVRDKNMFNALDTDDYDNSYVRFDDLTDITGTPEATLSNASAGWKLEMKASAGERVLGESYSFKGTVFFTSFTPAPIVATCGGASTGGGLNRLYRVSVADGTPRPNVDNIVDPEAPLTEQDRYEEIGLKGIAPPPTMFFTDDADGEPVLCIGVECEASGIGNDFTPTYWFQDETQ